jgi:phenylacetate-CoA ligase
MIAITPLEVWIKDKTNMDASATGASFTEALKSYQLQKLNDVIDYARRCTSIYRGRLSSISTPLQSVSDIAQIPFTSPADIAKDPFSFLAVRQDNVARIVTLRTSGSTGESKRLFFTEEDLELTVDFFHHGMSTMVRPGQRVAILLPGEMPDSVGDLLARGLHRMNVQTLKYGPVVDPCHTAVAIASFKAHCLVGIPTQVLAVACSQQGCAIGKGKIESVLLSTDYVPQAIAKRLEEIWGCRVFNHYGMTETGLGGGVECKALDGYHLREADLYFEIVDHETGEPCPDGVTGEVVFTTLTRQAMPLIRYRTGDIARMKPQSCPCGSVLRRMECVTGRWDGAVSLCPGCTLTIQGLDEALFQLHGLLDYRATISKEDNRRFQLTVDVHRAEGENLIEVQVIGKLNEVEAIAKGISLGLLEPPTVRFSTEGRWTTTGTAKRKIIVTDSLPS